MKNTISLETAQAWAARWKEMQNSGNIPTITAFLIPGIDTTQALKPDEAVDIRGYMGIDSTNTSRLIVVGVNSEGNDLIDESKGYYIYDFTVPCPPSCNKRAPFISR